MSDVDVTVFYNEHRVAAMERALKNTGVNLEDRLERALDSIYQELVPITEREQIEAQITREASEEYARQQAARRFAVVHFHDADDDFNFTTELSNKFYTMAYRYREFIKDEVGAVTLDSLARHFGEYEPVDDVTFSILCNTMPDDPRITAVADFDFENNTVSICERGDEWRTYDLKDVSTAVFKANRKTGLQMEAREAIFDEALEGKEILFEEASEDESEGPVLQM